MRDSDPKWPVSAKLAVVGLSLVSAVALVGLVVRGSFVPIGTALVGAGSVIAGAWLAGHWQVKHIRTQLQLKNRATAYLRLSEFVVRLRQAANTPASAGESMEDLADTLNADDWWSLQAHVEAFASSSVRQAFDEILTKRVRLRTALHSWNEERSFPPAAGPRSTSGLDRLEECREEVLAGCQELLEAINGELSADQGTES